MSVEEYLDGFVAIASATCFLLVMSLPLAFKWLIELESPLLFVFLMAFQTICVCVLEFNLEQKCLREFFFYCLTIRRALGLKRLNC